MYTRVDGTRWSLALGAVLLASLAWAGPAEAQQIREILISDLPIVEQVCLRAEAEERSAESTDLMRRAVAAEKRGEWRKVARLYEESGRLRTDGDLLVATSFERAGRAYFYSDRTGRAGHMWEEAGNRALVVGDVVGAARNFLYAAVAAQEQGKRVRATGLGWKAYHLTESEHLSPRERTLIREHLEVVPAS